MGLADKARKAFEIALEQDPGYASAWHELALLAMGEQDWSLARRHLQKALIFQPDMVPAHKNMGRCFLEWGDPEGALPHLDKAAELADASDHLQLAEVMWLKARCFVDDQEKLADVMTIFAALPHASLLPWHSDMVDLARQSGMELASKPESASWGELLPTAAPKAIFSEVSGVIKLSLGKTTWSAKPLTALTSGVRIEAEAGARGVLICSEGGVVNLTGPANLNVDELSCRGMGALGLFRVLLESRSRVTSSMGSWIKSTTRPGAHPDLHFLAPLGTTSSDRPDLVWTALEGVETWLLSLETEDFELSLTIDSKDTSSEEVLVGSLPINMVRLAWPDEALWPGDQLTIGLAPVLDNQSIDQTEIKVGVATEQQTEALNAALSAVDKSDFAPPAQRELRAKIFEELGHWGEALQYRRDLARSGGVSEQLALMQTRLAAGLDELAQKSCDYLLGQPLTPHEQADLEQALGMLDMRGEKWDEALEHLGRARLFFLGAHQWQEVSWIDLMMDDARKRQAIQKEHEQ